MKTALVLIDIQNDYFKGGRNELYMPEEAAMKASLILNFFRTKKLPVIHVQHIGSPEGGFFIPNTKGVEINAAVAPIDGEIIVEKHEPDSFLRTTLKEELDKLQITDLVVCGMMTHMCVDTSVRTAKHLGYNTTLIEDACTTMDLQWKGQIVPATQVQAAYMSPLGDCFAKVMTAAEWLEQ